MRTTGGITFWDDRSGSEFMAVWGTGRWMFAEREWGSASWYDVASTMELVQKLAEVLKKTEIQLAA